MPSSRTPLPVADFSVRPSALPPGCVGWVQRKMRLYEAPEPQAAEFRARQLQSVVSLVPITIAGNAINMAAVVSAFWATGPRAFLIGWLVVVSLLSGFGLPAWRRWRKGQFPQSVSARSHRRCLIHSAMIGLAWGIVPVVLAPHATGDLHTVLWLVPTGMICAGCFALGAMPMAGTTFVLCVTTGSVATVLSNPTPNATTMLFLIFAYAAVSVAAVWITGRVFGRNLMAEAESAQQTQLVGLLLRDFEENASDVLWETDADGLLRSPPLRLMGVLDASASEMASMPLTALVARRLRGPQAGRHAHLRQLRQALAAQQPFRDLILALQFGAQLRWSSISAKPLFDAQGQLLGWRGVACDVTHTQEANRQMRHMAHHDALTGLPNRRHFRDAARSVLQAETLGAGRRCAVICLDIDHFKTTNDTLGHAAGDALLMEFARRLQSCIRRGDLIARLGGDEFAALLVDVPTLEEADNLAQRMLSALQQPLVYQGVKVPVRTSLGLALAPRDGDEIDVLLNHADLALYDAKTAGRSTWRYFEPQAAQQARRRAQLEEALRSALAQGQMWLAYQPKIDLATSRIAGFEALLRWNHPEFGSVSPAEFIPVAEESGIIREIGAWVLQEATREAAVWPPHLTVAVNVSPIQVASQDVAAVVQQALGQSGLAAQRLELEITESIFMADQQTTVGLLHALHRIGVHVALDDFGTGFSSLSYLRSFPFNTLKIDRSFVNELQREPDSRAIVDTIMHLAHTLRMTTVAEGVETLEQIAQLRTHGCRLVQGYYIAKPMPAAEARAFVDGWGASPIRAALQHQRRAGGKPNLALVDASAEAKAGASQEQPASATGR